jgi:hypothetical protein
MIMKSGHTSASRFATTHLGTSVTDRSSDSLRHLPQTRLKNGLRLNIPLQGKPKLVRRVGWSQFRQGGAVVRRQADFSAAQGMRFGSMPSQANPDHVCGAAV